MRRVAALALALMLGACGGFREELPPVEYGTPPTASAEPAPAPVPVAKPGEALGGTVEVGPGDTVYAIARRHGVSMRGLIDLNGLAAPYALEVGQTLRLPEEYLHEVAPGDTLSAIARRYGVSMRLLATANDLVDPYVVKVGQRLRVPVAGEPAVAAAPVETVTVSAAPVVEVAAAPAEPAAPPPAEPEPVEPAVIATPEPAVVAAPEPEPVETVEPDAAPAPEVAPVALTAVPQPEPRSAALFAWPVRGTILSSFGPKPGGLNNDGINIAAPRGTPVVAAENGVVVYAGNEIPGFGNLILIRHADGWATAYAHNEKLLVTKGDTVARGQPIAQVGSTGSVAEPQSHFEIRKGNEPVDPMTYLSAE